MTGTFYLGVDGGGTRCRARLETEDGRKLGEGFAGPASMRFGFETVREAVMAATRQALQEACLPDDALRRTYAGIGLSGIGQPGARKALESWRHPFAGAWFEGDGYLAWLGAFGGEEGGVVIAGTGSIALAYDGSRLRIGGYGFPVSDEGSGASIGLAALRHALRARDGREEATAFARDVLAGFGDDTGAVAKWVEKASATDYAALAPLVVRHAQGGDPAARALMFEAGRHIAELVEALFRAGVPKVALIGGLSRIVKDYMPEETAARLSAPRADAMAGGILLARTRSAQLAASAASR